MNNTGKSIKIAVVGTGAAGLGVIAGLLEKHSDFEIIIYDIGQEFSPGALPENPSKEWINLFYDNIYRKIRSLYPFKFPPPKTHLGDQIPRQPVGKRLSLFKSESFGGLTNYWGSTMLPFTEREMKGWPISKEELSPYYQKIAELVGLSACPDALNEYFLDDFSNRPAIRPVFMLSRLNDSVNVQKNQGAYKIISGPNRCGVETREEVKNHCVYCGQCLAGCFKDSIFSARFLINQYLKDPRTRYRKSKVSGVRKKDNFFEIELQGGQKESGFSKVFLCAGCPGSSEIVMRSMDFSGKMRMADNAVYVFPIFYLGKRPKEARQKEYLSLCNLIFACVPKNKDEHFAQAQIYPNFEYLWRYNIPATFWPVLRPLLLLFWSRVFWARLYLHSDYSQAYWLWLQGNELKMDKIPGTKSPPPVGALMSSLRRAVNHQGFWIPPIPPLRQRVNSHYVGTMPFGGSPLNVSALGEVMPGFHVCDSSCFPSSPAVNPGFTIMANAYRIADEAF